MWQSVTEYLYQDMTLRELFVWLAVAYVCFLLASFSAQQTLKGEDFATSLIWVGWILGMCFLAWLSGAGSERRFYIFTYLLFLVLLSWAEYEMSKPRKKQRVADKDPLATLEQLLAEAKAKVKITEQTTEPRQAKTIDIESLKQRLEKIKGDDSE